MEFIQYNEFLDSLKPSGLTPVTENGLVRFMLKNSNAPTLEPVALVFGDTHSEKDPPGARVIGREAAALPHLMDSIIHKEHLTEVAMCPAREWSAIVDLIAFDLATDDHWNDIDAEAALHLRTRNPLMLDSPDLRLVEKIAASVVAGGEPGSHDFAVIALGSPLVLNLEQRGRLTVWCGNPAMADIIAKLA